MGNLNQYLVELEASLDHLDAATRREIVEEVAGHLKDQAHYFQLSGLSEEESMSKATRCFGRAVDIGRKIGEVHPPRRGFGLSAAAVIVLLQGSLLLAVLLLGLGIGPLHLPMPIISPENGLTYLAAFVITLTYLAAAYGLWQMRRWGFFLSISLQLLELAGVINRGTTWVGFSTAYGTFDVIPPLLVLYLPIAYVRYFQVRMPWNRSRA